MATKRQKSVKLTAEHFAIFKSECLRWAKWFALDAWEFYIEQKKLPMTTMADTSWDFEAATAKIRFPLKWSGAWTEAEIRDEIGKTAFHEVAHIYFAPLHSAATDERRSPKEVDGYVHANINLLMNRLCWNQTKGQHL